MKADFHYYAVAVLARAAGYPLDHALTIAYASQYTDDAASGRPFLVGGRIFDPVLTLPDWRGQVLVSSSLSVQAQVYTAFHFLPREFCAELVRAARRAPGLYGLVKLGIALHTFADSFAHVGFSGRWEQGNAVERLEVINGYPPPWETFAGVAYPVGHAQAGTIPDLGWAHWRAHMASGEVIERDNRATFKAAAAAILDPLGGTMAGRGWRLMDELWQVRGTEAERCEAWQEAWGTPAYDKEAWEREARAAASDEDEFIITPWALWHRAARAQRCRVMEEFALL